ncbi:MAG: replicative DNA helicase [Planctomycetota bacterium]|nr:replicative DNA helicase [Planctomycetota bacterium]
MSGRPDRDRRFSSPPLSAKELFERQPPASPEAEMSLLGSMILDPNVIPDVLGMVRRPEDFFTASHGHIYQAVVDVYDQRHSGDLVQILDLLRDRGVLEQIGGPNYLAELAAAVPSAVNAPHFARIVAEKAKLRRLIDAAGQIIYEAYHAGELGPEGAREVLDAAEMRVFEIAQETHAADPQALAELLDIELARIEAADFEGGSLSGVPSGYDDLDELLRGFQPGEMVILAARPSMGKTALALNLAEQMAIGGVPVPGAPAGRRSPVGLFSLEMSKNAIVQRLLSARSGVSSQALRGGHKIPDDDFRRLMMAAEDLKAAPVYIDDTPNLTVLNLRARARRMVAQHSVKVLMIDYLQLMSSPNAARESRQVEVSAISRGVKALARELNVPVICLSQLNRASESREGNRPRMSDLRESGSIEQDADVIMLLHREEYYHVHNPEWGTENPDKVGIAEIIIAKQRNGPTGVIKLAWDNRTTRFKSYDPGARAPADIGPLGHAPRSNGYDRPSHAASGFGGSGFGGAPASGAKPWTHAEVKDAPPFAPGAPGGGFGGRAKSGPIDGHRDGGGPDRDEPPFDEDAP